MKRLTELLATPRLMITQASYDGGCAEAHLASSAKHRPATVIFSRGCGWDHVSVSFNNRCPTWEEMCEIKSMFFHPDEVVVQYHPAESDYVNNHPYCLHLWRPQEQAMPTPPAWMVGAKKGQTLADAFKEAEAELEGGAGHA